VSFERRRRPGPTSLGSVGAAGAILLALTAAGIWAVWHLHLTWSGLWPGRGGWTLAGDFLGRALHPALSFQGPSHGAVVGGLIPQALRAAGMTVVFAATAWSLAVIGGLVLGGLGSGSLMRGRWLRPLVLPARLVSNLLRSVHELIWAVLLLAALGYGSLVAVLAIALPYAGTLAKIFSEMMDEVADDAAQALELSGASNLQRFVFGVLPRAVPEMVAYSFYRFECALRSSAVLGFFGFPTLGYYLAASFDNLYYAEVWTYLYTLLLLVVAVDWWSGRLRRELLS